jgi:hypothetical protein
LPRFIAERADVMARMEKDQDEARKGGVEEEQILQYLVDKHHPTFRELRRIRNPMGSFTSIDKNERVLVSDKSTRKEINIFNRFQRLMQEIGATKEEWNMMDGIHKVWVYVLLVGEDAKAARVRNELIGQGIKSKDERLVNAIRNTTKRKKAADAQRKIVEAAIRKGRRRP